MSVAAAQNPLTIPRPRSFCCLSTTQNRLRIPPFFNSFPPSRPLGSRNARRFVSIQRKNGPSRWRIRVFESGEAIDERSQREISGELSLDHILSFTEVLLIAPPAIYSIGCVVGLLIPGVIKPFQVNLGSKFFVWQFILLVGAVATGVLIRRRQWARICRKSDGAVGVDLLARIEKVEEDLRSSATIVRVLSRQLEKLGIRFRVTRKALKEPITEAATLAQKNSEATRMLAMQGDILEKELGEIQKVLLAMQEQQQKQLELILAIGKAGRLLDNKKETAAATVQGTTKSSDLITENTATSSRKSRQEDIQGPKRTA